MLVFLCVFVTISAAEYVMLKLRFSQTWRLYLTLVLPQGWPRRVVTQGSQHPRSPGHGHDPVLAATSPHLTGWWPWGSTPSPGYQVSPVWGTFGPSPSNLPGVTALYFFMPGTCCYFSPCAASLYHKHKAIFSSLREILFLGQGRVWRTGEKVGRGTT